MRMRGMLLPINQGEGHAGCQLVLLTAECTRYREILLAIGYKSSVLLLLGYWSRI